MDREKRGVWVYYRARTGAMTSLATLIGSPAGSRAVTMSTARS
jgi:ArsR family transcriptional regulator